MGSQSTPEPHQNNVHTSTHTHIYTPGLFFSRIVPLKARLGLWTLSYSSEGFCRDASKLADKSSYIMETGLLRFVRDFVICIHLATYQQLKRKNKDMPFTPKRFFAWNPNVMAWGIPPFLRKHKTPNLILCTGCPRKIWFSRFSAVTEMHISESCFRV
jgi:hypothetical protein